MDTSTRDAMASSVMKFAAQQGQSVQQGKTEYNTAADSAIASKNTEADAQQQSGVDAATVTRELGGLQLSSDAYMQKIAANLGIGDNSEHEILLGLADKHRQASVDLVAANKKVNDLNSVGVLDNPLQYLINTLQLPAAKTELRNAAGTLNAVGTAMKDTFQQGQDAAQTLIATKAKTTAAAVDAQAQQQLAAANAVAAGTRAAAFQWRAQDVQANMQFDSQQLASMEAQYRTLQTEDSWKLQQRTAARQDELARMQIDKLNKSESADEGAYGSMRDTILAAAARNGIPIVMPENSLQYQAAIKYNSAFAKQTQDLYAMGSSAAVTGTEQFGPTPAIAALTRQALNIQPTTPGGKATAQLVDTTWQQLNSREGLLDASGAPMVDPLTKAPYIIPKTATKEEAINIWNSAVQAKLSQTPPKLAPIGAVTSSFRNMEQWPLFQAIKNVDTGNLDSPLKVGTITDLAKFGIAAYKKGDISITDLGNNLHSYAQLALRKFEQDNEYARNGIQPLKVAAVDIGGHTWDLATTEGQLALMQSAIADKRGVNSIFGVNNPGGRNATIQQGNTTDQRTVELLNAARKLGVQ